MNRVIATAAVLVTAGILAAAAHGGTTGTLSAAPGRFILVAPTSAAYTKLARAAAAQSKAPAGSLRVTSAVAPLDSLAIVAWPSEAEALASRFGAVAIPDGIRTLIGREEGTDPSKVTMASVAGRPAAGPRAQHRAAGDVLFGFTPDPAFDRPGLMWGPARIGAPQAWSRNAGDSHVLVGVEDTGLDYTHVELQHQIASIQDFTIGEELWPGGPSLCQYYQGFDDGDLADFYGQPRDLDWNGHGTWIGGAIAAEVNGNAANGIAPGVSLVGLKISNWCGFALDSELLGAIGWAADHGVDVVNLSFGGYLDRRDRAQDRVWGLYKKAAEYAKRRGTQVVVAAGNNHIEIGADGKVKSHGGVSAPPGLDPAADLFGLYEAPAGVPGYLAVSSTGNVVGPPSATCAGGSAEWIYPFCKPVADPHQPFGAGKTNQLVFSSNYGQRIDFAGTGGAPKFNLPPWDRGGTPGWPFTGPNSVSDVVFGGDTASEGYTGYHDFGISSNYGLDNVCFVFGPTAASEVAENFGANHLAPEAGFGDGQCYTSIRGTSMAAPYVAAVYALVASAFPQWRFKPEKIVDRLKATATKPVNFTPPLSKTDTSTAELWDADCPLGYCHVGGKAISNADAYGNGLVDAGRAVQGSP